MTVLIRGFGTLVMALGLAVVTHAQPAPPAASPPTEQDVSAALERYERGVALFQESAFSSALVEFQAAYDRAPNYRVLYNIAVTHFQLGQSAQAYDAYIQYLAEGDTAIPPERREEVEGELQRLRELVAWLSVDSTVAGASVLVDGDPIGEVPLTNAVTVDAGTLRLALVLDGDVLAETVTLIEPGERQTVRLEPRTPEVVAATEPVDSPPTLTPFWIMTSAAAAVGLAAGVTGALALASQNDLDAELAIIPADRTVVAEARDEVRLRSTVTDILGAGAAVLGGVSIYFLIAYLTSERPTEDTALQLEVGPMGATLHGTF